MSEPPTAVIKMLFDITFEIAPKAKNDKRYFIHISLNLRDASIITQKKKKKMQY